MTDTGNLELFLDQAGTMLGPEHINITAETLDRYGENTLPDGNRMPSAVLYPGSTEEVAAVVRLANEHRVPLHPISTGNNMGLGTRSAPAEGMIVLDLGRRMNRILEIDDKMGFAAVEPGVSFQMMADELKRRGGQWMMSVTSGPPEGGMIGNAMDKGAGYGPLFDHFGFSCGMEVVLGNGEILRTGEGIADLGPNDNVTNWHVSKYAFGPIIDGLFAQSNFGIVTRLGIWFMPRPPTVRSFHFTFPDDGDLGDIIDLCRPLKMSNFVPTLFRVSNDLYLIGSEVASPSYAESGGTKSISNAERKALQDQHRLGSWNVSGAFYGPSIEVLEPQIQRICDHFGASGKARYISHEEALESAALSCAISSFSGEPTTTELGLLKWRPGGGNAWFTPGTPMDGEIANEFQKIGRDIYEANGMDYTVMNVCAARFARGLHVIGFNRENDEETERARRTYEQLADAFHARGIGVGRAPIDWHDYHYNKTIPAFRNTCESIKSALDPNHILSPGRYGIN
jgi:4-cresol dehydrogenase (hydroxylating) flavoprotein subunit